MPILLSRKRHELTRHRRRAVVLTLATILVAAVLATVVVLRGSSPSQTWLGSPTWQLVLIALLTAATIAGHWLLRARDHFRLQVGVLVSMAVHLALLLALSVMLVRGMSPVAGVWPRHDPNERFMPEYGGMENPSSEEMPWQRPLEARGRATDAQVDRRDTQPETPTDVQADDRTNPLEVAALPPERRQAPQPAEPRAETPAVARRETSAPDARMPEVEAVEIDDADQPTIDDRPHAPELARRAAQAPGVHREETERNEIDPRQVVAQLQRRRGTAGTVVADALALHEPTAPELARQDVLDPAEQAVEMPEAATASREPPRELAAAHTPQPAPDARAQLPRTRDPSRDAAAFDQPELQIADANEPRREHDAPQLSDSAPAPPDPARRTAPTAPSQDIEAAESVASATEPSAPAASETPVERQTDPSAPQLAPRSATAAVEDAPALQPAAPQLARADGASSVALAAPSLPRPSDYLSSREQMRGSGSPLENEPLRTADARGAVQPSEALAATTAPGRSAAPTLPSAAAGRTGPSPPTPLPSGERGSGEGVPGAPAPSTAAPALGAARPSGGATVALGPASGRPGGRAETAPLEATVAPAEDALSGATVAGRAPAGGPRPAPAASGTGSGRRSGSGLPGAVAARSAAPEVGGADQGPSLASRLSPRGSPSASSTPELGDVGRPAELDDGGRRAAISQLAASGVADAGSITRAGGQGSGSAGTSPSPASGSRSSGPAAVDLALGQRRRPTAGAQLPRPGGPDGPGALALRGGVGDASPSESAASAASRPIVSRPAARTPAQVSLAAPAHDSGDDPREPGGSLVASRPRDVISPSFALRQPEVRLEVLEMLGGPPESERAVQAALAWLAAHQAPDGHWSFHEFHQQCSAHGGEPCSGAGDFQADTAATGLALLPFLGAGNTHHQGPYRETVRRGLEWLIARQADDGDLFTGGHEATWLYSHGIAAIALCEAYGLTHDERLREPVEHAVAFIVASQDRELGGWRYQPGQNSDTSVSGWMLMALQSARMAGLEVPKETLDGVTRWLNLAAGREPGQYAYQRGRNATPTMTAEALLMRQYLGWDRDHPELRAGVDSLMRHLPSSDERNAYYWYYATQVMFHMQDRYWDAWHTRLAHLLISTQETAPGVAGSWNPVGDEFVPGASTNPGRLYVTCLHALCLEAYYRHLPLYRQLGE